MQQFRKAPPGDHPYPFVIHDRDSIFSRERDQGGDRYGRASAANTSAGAQGKGLRFTLHLLGTR